MTEAQLRPGNSDPTIHELGILQRNGRKLKDCEIQCTTGFVIPGTCSLMLAL